MGKGGGLQRQAKACPYRYKAERGRVREEERGQEGGFGGGGLCQIQDKVRGTKEV